MNPKKGYAVLTADYSKKVIHVAVNVLPSKGRSVEHQGLIFSPNQVFSKVNDRAEDLFAEFFMAGQQYKLICLQTEMGPGELAGVFGERFGVVYSMSIGGTIAPFSLKPAVLKSFWQQLTQNPKLFLKSKEKKTFAREPIRGLEVKV